VPGTIEAICIGAHRGVAKREVATAELRRDHGLVNDAHAGPGYRQVSVLALAAAQRYGRGQEAERGDFAANLILAGLDLDAVGLGTSLRVGATARLAITRLGGSRPDATEHPGPGHHRMPPEGMFARVVEGGPIAVGDQASIDHLIPRSTFQVAVLTLSDRCAAGTAQDTTGPALASLVRQAMGAHIFATEILPDGKERLAERLCDYADGNGVDLVIAAGGTGPSPRDQTPEAVRAVVDRLTPGFDEAMRQASMASTPLAMLSRACSGFRGTTLIVSVPGSERAATENLRAILPALPHCLEKLRGDPSECGRPTR
jgi:molybdopterin adenylyltransferase